MARMRGLAGILLFIFSPAASEQRDKLCEREMIQAATKFQVPLGILFAVGLTETGMGGTLHAYALNLEGTTVYSLNKEQAIERFISAKAAGMKMIDVGCMQLNYYFHGDRFSSIADMLEPHRNVDYAARFLSELRAREGSWTMAVARYNAGKNNNPGQKRYVCKVLARLAESGFGAWTPQSEAFCKGEHPESGNAQRKSQSEHNSLAQAR